MPCSRTLYIHEVQVFQSCRLTGFPSAHSSCCYVTAERGYFNSGDHPITCERFSVEFLRRVQSRSWTVPTRHWFVLKVQSSECNKRTCCHYDRSDSLRVCSGSRASAASSRGTASVRLTLTDGSPWLAASETFTWRPAASSLSQTLSDSLWVPLQLRLTFDLYSEVNEQGLCRSLSILKSLTSNNLSFRP